MIVNAKINKKCKNTVTGIGELPEQTPCVYNLMILNLFNILHGLLYNDITLYEI